MLVAGHLFNFKVTQNMANVSSAPNSIPSFQRVGGPQTTENNLNAENQQSRFRRCARIVTPIVGLLVAGAGAYALASGVNRDNYDQTDTYHLNLVNGLSGAAGAVGGALVSWLADKAVSAYCCVRDRAVQPVELVGEQQPKESDFTTSEPGAQGEGHEAQPGDPASVNLKTIPVGGVQIAAFDEFHHYVDVVNQGKAAQGDNKQS